MMYPREDLKSRQTVQEDEELEDVDALDDIFADNKDIDKDFCEGYLNEIQLV